jgi:hypothetical protein
VLEWLGRIAARGGTEMGPALHTALRLLAQSGSEQAPAAASSETRNALTSVVLITDGQVTGEDAILRRLSEQEAGETIPRFYIVGIDQAVNEGFLTRLAAFTQGQCELVESAERLDAVMSRIHRLLGTPVLTDVRLEPLSGDWLAGDTVPARLPDLFAGNPLVIYGRHLSDHAGLRLRVHAVDGSGQPWSADVSGKPAPSSLLASMWGRGRVRELEDQYASGLSSAPDELMKRIVETSLATHVLSRFTAYVAVDRSEVVNQGGAQHQIVQPVEMPQGWNMQGALLAAGVLSAAAPAVCYDAKSFGVSARRGRSMFLRDCVELLGKACAQPVDALWDKAEGEPSKTMESIFAEAAQRRATEIHIEPLGDRLRVIYQINGQLVERGDLPLSQLVEIVEYLRSLASMQAPEGASQQGELVASVGQQRLRFRLTITSTPHGESVRLVLDPAQAATLEGSAKRGRRRKKFWT